MAKTKRVKFPSPMDYKAADPEILCPAERVIKLYNQDSGDTAKRIAKKVRKWFTATAIARGWKVRFLPEVQTKHGAGCVLSRPGET